MRTPGSLSANALGSRFETTALETPDYPGEDRRQSWRSRIVQDVGDSHGDIPDRVDDQQISARLGTLLAGLLLGGISASLWWAIYIFWLA